MRKRLAKKIVKHPHGHRCSTWQAARARVGAPEWYARGRFVRGDEFDARMTVFSARFKCAMCCVQSIAAVRITHEFLEDEGLTMAHTAALPSRLRVRATQLLRRAGCPHPVNRNAEIPDGAVLRAGR